MKKINIGVVVRGAGSLVFAAAFLALPNVSWASASACAAATQISTLGTANTSGCFGIDQTFNNIAVANPGGGTGTNTGLAQSTATDNIQYTSTYSALALNTPWTVDAVFTPNATADWQITGSGGDFLEGAVSLISNSSHSATYTADSSYVSPSAGDQIIIHTASLLGVGTTGATSGDAMTVVEVLCVGSAACVAGVGGNEITLTETWTNNDSSPSLTCTAVAAAGATCAAGVATFTVTTNTVNVVDTYTLTTHGNTRDTLTSFTNVFTDEEIAPEPSTFVLLGTALSGLGFLRLRRKKA